MTPVSTAEPEWDDLKREFGAACAQAAQEARLKLAQELNGLFRRFRQYENESGWVSLVMEGAAKYAHQAALFVVEQELVELRGRLNFELPQTLRIATGKAAAFDAALHSKEAVTALRSVSEVGVELSAVGQLGHLFPILNGSRVAAVLFVAAGDDLEIEALELVCGMAASVLERPSNAGLHSHIALVSSTPAKVAPPERRLTAWADLPAGQRQAHSQAARFARMAVAEIQLAKPAACQAARQSGNLYVLLGKEIDKARETYRRQFMTIPLMADYFHRELTSSLLGGDATKLGADYPGELA